VEIVLSQELFASINNCKLKLMSVLLLSVYYVFRTVCTTKW